MTRARRPERNASHSAPPRPGRRSTAGFAVGCLTLAIALAGLAGCSSGGVRAGAVPTPPPVEPAGVVTGGAAGSASASPSTSTAACNPYAISPAPAPGDAGSALLARIRAQGKLIVGVSADGYLTGYADSSGTEAGFDIDIARQIEQAIFGTTDTAHIAFKSVTLAQRTSDLQNGTVDMVVDTMTITCQRATQVGFSSVYYDSKQRLLVPRGSGIGGLGDLKSADTVCVQADSTSIAPIKAAPGHPKILQVTDLSDCLVALQQNQAEAISTDDTILAGLAKQDPNTEVVGPSLGDDPYGVAVPLGQPQFAGFVNGVLAHIEQDGTWASIYNTWFAAALGPATPPQPQYAG
jgi:polar amino acid transport system substrate-binding protein